eukprot:TRINITY_DN10866_c0_g1_i1.p1 TRINITY_DN10866_c0_g1~~TRINITY_DN10866_c0_g1_i1.p1  ORF type:complete len:346 (-),score=69.90 TRINITY_DN10866_c0_g1_i1:34-1014(-)
MCIRDRVNRASLSSRTMGNEKRKLKINPELDSILAMISDKFNTKGLKSIWGIASVDEEKIAKISKTNEKALVDFHKKYFTRIYPKGTRVDSSNYSPVEPWIYGSQVVALNFQTRDEAMLLNKAKFEENGGVAGGYVLKPEFMLSGNDPQYPSDFSKPLKQIRVRIISGQQLRFEKQSEDIKDIVDPYIKVSIRGLKQDEKSRETKLIEDNGFNPVWKDQEHFDFRICGPDFAFLKFEVFDKDRFKSTRIGWYATPINMIRSGYRIVPLLNSQLDPIPFSVLLVEIQFSPVEEEFPPPTTGPQSGKVSRSITTVSYTHLTLPTIYSV